MYLMSSYLSVKINFRYGNRKSNKSDEWCVWLEKDTDENTSETDIYAPECLEMITFLI